MTREKWDRLPLDQRALWIESIPGQRGFFPWLGICGSVLGTIVALAAVPYDPSQQGALRVSGIAMSLGLIVAPLLAGIVNPRNFMRTENIIGACPAYWLIFDLVQGTSEMPGVTVEAAQTTLAAIGLCTACFWFGTIGKPWSLPKPFLHSCSIRPPTGVLFGIVVSFFVLAMLSYAIPCGFSIPLMIESLGVGRWSAPWARGRLGDWDAFRDHLAYFGYLLPAFAVMVCRRKGWMHPLSLASMLQALIFLTFLAQGGSRRLVGATLGAAVCCWVLDRPKVKLFQIAIAGGAVVAILWLMQVMIYARDNGFEEGGNRALAVATYNLKFKKLSTNELNYIRIDDNFYRVANIAKAIPKEHDYIGFEYIYYVLIRPIPRAIWKDKPIDPGYAITLMSLDGTLLSCTVIGEFYMSWGFWATALGGWLLGRASRLNFPFFHSATGSLAPLFYGYMSMWLFVGYRSLVEIVLFTYPLLAWMVLSWLMRDKLRRAR